MTFLLTVWKYRNLVGFGAVALLIGGLWIWKGVVENQRDALAVKYDKAMTDLNSATEIARRNAEQVLRLEDERKRTLAIMDEARAADSKRQEILNEIIKEVNNAPLTDCPAGDRLDAANRGLLKLSTEGAGH